MTSSNGLLCTQKHVCKLLQLWVRLHLIIPVILMSRVLWNGFCYCQCREWTFFPDASSLPNISLTLTLLTWRIWWAPNNASRWQMGFNSAFKGLTYISLFQKYVSLPGVPITGTKSLNFRINLFHKRNVLAEHELLRVSSFPCQN